MVESGRSMPPVTYRVSPTTAPLANTWGAEAERSLRHAIYLDRNFLLAHYHLGLALAKGIQPRLAARSFKNVLRLSGGMRDQQILENGDGLTVAALKQMAKMHLQNSGVL